MKNILKKKLDVSHIAFSMLFTTSLFVIWNALNIDKIVKWFSLGDGIDYAGLLAFLIFGLCFFIAVFILFAHRRTIKPLAIIFILLSATVTYFISKYNVAIDRSMVMNSIHTDVTEARSFLTVHMIPYVFFLMVLPILVVTRANITFQSAARYLSTSLALFALAIVVAAGSVYANYNSIHRAVNQSNKYVIHTLVPINYIGGIYSAVQRSIEIRNRRNSREVVVSGHVSAQDDLVVVLAIGETSRQKSFSLYGYERRNTNPVLSQDDGLSILNGKARIGTTRLALRDILERDDIKLPAITSKLGIDTSCFVNYTLYDNCNPVVEVHADDCGHDGKCYDEDVIPLLEDDLKTYTSGYRFLVLHFGGGSHGPNYRNRFPPEFEHFQPQCLEADIVNHCTEEELYNSYDNSILYVDYVVGEAIRRLDDSGVPYVFVYLSDHGESLLEEGRIFHGMPPGIPLPPEQAQVPLIVKSSVPVSIEQRDEYTQQDVFDSVLGLFSIESEILNKERVFIKKIDDES